jgi:hypothetical protein
MQDLDQLLTKATDALRKAQESIISVTDQNTVQSIKEPVASGNLYFKQSKGLVLLNPLESKLELKKEKSIKIKDTSAGPDWFHMPAIEMTDEVKKDLHIIKNRGVLDPKRHYRKEKLGVSPFVQIGTVIQGPTEYYSSRLLKKERGENIVQELLADAESNRYFKKKYLEIQDKKSRFTKRKVYKRKGRKTF